MGGLGKKEIPKKGKEEGKTTKLTRGETRIVRSLMIGSSIVLLSAKGQRTC